VLKGKQRFFPEIFKKNLKIEGLTHTNASKRTKKMRTSPNFKRYNQFQNKQKNLLDII
jgi:hypothetical protein